MKCSLVLGLAAATNPIGPIGQTVSISGTPVQGLTYNPFREDQSCQSAQNIEQDFDLMAQVTKNIRTYATGCGHELPILKSAAKRGMQVSIGLWVSQYPAVFEEQLAQLITALKSADEADKQALSSVVVGNESLFRGEVDSTTLASYINRTRDALKAVGLEKVPLTTSEALIAYYEDPIIADVIDFFMPNIHVFFDGFSIDETIGNLFYRYEKVLKMAKGKKIIIGETGWPSAGAPFTEGSKSIPSAASASYLLNTFLCEANRRGLEYFYFDAFNADWKKTFWPVQPDEEFYWGLFTADRSAMKPYVKDALTCSKDTYLNWTPVAVCNGNPYNEQVYNCSDEVLLCPKPLFGCGTIDKFSCYDANNYKCVNGDLVPK